MYEWEEGESEEIVGMALTLLKSLGKVGAKLVGKLFKGIMWFLEEILIEEGFTEEKGYIFINEEE